MIPAAKYGGYIEVAQFKGASSIKNAFCIGETDEVGIILDGSFYIESFNSIHLFINTIIKDPTFFIRFMNVFNALMLIDCKDRVCWIEYDTSCEIKRLMPIMAHLGIEFDLVKFGIASSTLFGSKLSEETILEDDEVINAFYDGMIAHTRDEVEERDHD